MTRPPRPRGGARRRATLFAALRRPPERARCALPGARLRRRPDRRRRPPARALLCYELHYRGFDGVDDALGVGTRRCSRCARALERPFEAGAARALVPRPSGRDARRDRPRAARDRRRRRRPVAVALRRDARDASSSCCEFLVHRSAYQLKEADPHSWAIPRLSGAPKAALVEIQADEYGGGDAGARSTRTLFANAMARARARPALRRLPRPPARGARSRRST